MEECREPCILEGGQDKMYSLNKNNDIATPHPVLALSHCVVLGN